MFPLAELTSVLPAPPLPSPPLHSSSIQLFPPPPLSFWVLFFSLADTTRIFQTVKVPAARCRLELNEDDRPGKTNLSVVTAQRLSRFFSLLCDKQQSAPRWTGNEKKENKTCLKALPLGWSNYNMFMLSTNSSRHLDVRPAQSTWGAAGFGSGAWSAASRNRVQIIQRANITATATRFPLHM